jgi:DNA-binding NarL/FixJ family response regulator
MPSRKIRLLIVDDSDAVRGAIRSLLHQQKDRFDVYESPSAEDAIHKGRENRPQIILLDLSLPGVSGMELAKRMRTELPDSKIVVMSAQDPAVLRTLTELAGLQLCIVKTELSAELLPLLARIAPE